MSKASLLTSLILCSLLTLLSSCSSKENVKGHELHVFKGSFPFVGEPIEVRTDTKRPTTIIFPLRIAQVLIERDIAVIVNKRENKMQVKAKPELTSEGEIITATIIDGRQYKLRVVYDEDISDKHRRLVNIQGARKNVAATINPSTTETNADAEKLFASLEGKSNKGIRPTSQYLNTQFISTATLQAVIQESVETTGFVAHRLEVKNLSDQPITLRPVDFTARGASSVRIDSKTLEPRPMTLVRQGNGLTKKHIGRVLVVVPRR